MSNIDENFCKNCGKTPVYVREHCRKCYYKLTQNGTLSIKIHKKSPDFLTEYQQNILTGTLLGDAHLKKITESQLPPAQGWWLVSSISAPTIG
jgi:hypothetical protein